MKQTAVEFLVEKLKSQGLLIGEPNNLVAVNQAKEMEKEQIILSHINGQYEYDSQAFSSTNKKLAENYYNETFNK